MTPTRHAATLIGFLAAALLLPGCPSTTARLVPQLGGGFASVITLSPDARWVAVGGQPAVSLWDASSGTRLRALTGATGNTTSLTFVAKGMSLVGANNDKHLRMWDTASGTLLIDRNVGWAIRADATDDLAITAPIQRGKLQVWRLSDEAILAERAAKSVNFVAIGPKESQAFTTDDDGRLIRWSFPDLAKRTVLYDKGEAFGTMSFAPNDNSILVAFNSHAGHRFDRRTGARTWSDPDPSSLTFLVTRREYLRWDSNYGIERSIFVGSQRRRKVDTLALHGAQRPRPGTTPQLSLTPDKSYGVLASPTTLTTFATRPLAVQRSWRFQADHIGAVAISGDGKWVGSTNGSELSIWNALTGRRLKRVVVDQVDAPQVTLDSTGSRALLVEDDTVGMLDIRQGTLLWVVKSTTDDYNSSIDAGVNPAWTQVVLATGDGGTLILDAGSGKTLETKSRLNIGPPQFTTNGGLVATQAGGVHWNGQAIKLGYRPDNVLPVSEEAIVIADGNRLRLLKMPSGMRMRELKLPERVLTLKRHRDGVLVGHRSGAVVVDVGLTRVLRSVTVEGSLRGQVAAQGDRIVASRGSDTLEWFGGPKATLLLSSRTSGDKSVSWTPSGAFVGDSSLVRLVEKGEALPPAALQTRLLPQTIASQLGDTALDVADVSGPPPAPPLVAKPAMVFPQASKAKPFPQQAWFTPLALRPAGKVTAMTKTTWRTGNEEAISLGANDRVLVSGTRVLDVSTGAPILDLDGVSFVKAAASSTRLAIVYEEQLLLWDLSLGHAIGTLPGAFLAAALSPDGTMLATWSTEHGGALRKVGSPTKVVRRLTCRDVRPRELTWSADGSTLLIRGLEDSCVLRTGDDSGVALGAGGLAGAISTDGAVVALHRKLFDSKVGYKLGDISGLASPLRFADDGSTSFARLDGIYLINALRGAWLARRVVTVESPWRTVPIHESARTLDGRWLFVPDHNLLRRFDLVAGAEAPPSTRTWSQVRKLRARKGGHVIANTFQHPALLETAEANAQPRPLGLDIDPIGFVASAVSEDGQQVALGNSEHLRLFTGDKHTNLIVNGDVKAVELAGPTLHLAVEREGLHYERRDAATGVLIDSRPLAGGHDFEEFAFAADGQWLVATDQGETLFAIQTRRGKTWRQVHKEGSARHFAAAQNSPTVVLGAGVVVDLATRKTQMLAGPGEQVSITPDGTTVAIRQEESISTFDVATGRRLGVAWDSRFRAADIAVLGPRQMVAVDGRGNWMRVAMDAVRENDRLDVATDWEFVPSSDLCLRRVSLPHIGLCEREGWMRPVSLRGDALDLARGRVVSGGYWWFPWQPPAKAEHLPTVVGADECFAVGRKLECADEADDGGPSTRKTVPFPGTIKGLTSAPMGLAVLVDGTVYIHDLYNEKRPKNRKPLSLPPVAELSGPCVLTRAGDVHCACHDEERPAYTKVVGVGKATKLATSWREVACAVTKDGVASCWSPCGPKPVKRFENVHDLVVVGEEVCALGTAGDLVCRNSKTWKERKVALAAVPL